MVVQAWPPELKPWNHRELGTVASGGHHHNPSAPTARWKAEENHLKAQRPVSLDMHISRNQRLSIQGDRLTKSSTRGKASVRNESPTFVSGVALRKDNQERAWAWILYFFHLSVTYGFWSTYNLSVSLNLCLPVCWLCSPFVRQHGQHRMGKELGIFYRNLVSFIRDCTLLTLATPTDPDTGCDPGVSVFIL